MHTHMCTHAHTHTLPRFRDGLRDTARLGPSTGRSFNWCTEVNPTHCSTQYIAVDWLLHHWNHLYITQLFYFAREACGEIYFLPFNSGECVSRMACITMSMVVQPHWLWVGCKRATENDKLPGSDHPRCLYSWMYTPHTCRVLWCSGYGTWLQIKRSSGAARSWLPWCGTVSLGKALHLYVHSLDPGVNGYLVGHWLFVFEYFPVPWW